VPVCTKWARVAPAGRAASRGVLTEIGRIALEVPRDRLSTFDPLLIAKYQRRFPGFDQKLISMYARGMGTPLRLASRHVIIVGPSATSLHPGRLGLHAQPLGGCRCHRIQGDPQRLGDAFKTI
jgi:hypothetical protein